MVTKRGVVQSLLSLYPAPRYLEVGVRKGATFHSVKAASKVAVDPVFRFDIKQAARANRGAAYFSVTSDIYFREVVALNERFDVIYLDGLHTFEQTLRDFTNAIHFLSDKGIILIDDVVPNGPFAALPDQALFNAKRAENPAIPRAWMGDVFRLVYFIETFFQQYTYRTVSDNLGQLVVWRGRRTPVHLRSVESTAQARYDELPLNAESFRFACFSDILTEVREHVSTPAKGSPAWFLARTRQTLRERFGI